MIIFHLLLLAIKRLISRMSLTALFLLTTGLAVGIVACVPMFAGAVSARIMQEELGMLSGKRKHLQPVSVRFYASATASRPLDIGAAEEAGRWLHQTMLRNVGIPLAATYMEVQSPRYDLMPLPGDTRYTEKTLDQVYVVYADKAEANLRLLDGQPFGTVVDPKALNIWISKTYADEFNLHTGERLIVGDVYDAQKGRTEVLIVGIWEPADPDAQFWWYTDTIWYTDGVFLTTRAEFEKSIYPVLPAKTQNVAWQVIMNDRRMNLSRAEEYIAGLKESQKAAEARLPRGGMDQAPTEYLLRGEQRKEALTVILLGFSVPLLVIILYSVSALSSVLSRFQAQEIAMLNSRGSTRWQIIAFSLLETAVILTVSIPLGLGIALLLTYLLGFSASFLQFVARDPLPVYLGTADWRLIGLTVGAIGLTRLFATWSSAGRTIITQEREHVRRRWVFGSMRLIWMGFLAAATYYAYFRLTQVGTLALISWESKAPSHDPLLLAAPSLFFLTVPMILAELFALLTRPIGWLGKLMRSIAIYLGLQDLGREGIQYRTPAYMLILCLSLGVFYASLARSADTWLVDRRRYEVGSDLQYNPRGAHVVAGKFAKVDEESEFYEPAVSVPMSDFEAVPGVRAASPVGEYEAAVMSSKAPTARLLAIDRLTFAQVAYYRRDYAPEPLGGLMNRLGTEQHGILMPRYLAEEMQVSEGSAINLNVLVGDQQRFAYEFVVVGLFDYFPTMFQKEAPVFVANLEYLQSQAGGTLPYNIWMRTDPTVDGEKLVQNITSHTHVMSERVVNLNEIMAQDQGRLERVGLFGVLSVCFLAGALLATFGLLVHNAASLRGRSLRFAVLQALGMARGSVLVMVLTEYIGVLVYSVIGGTALGIIGAHLYVPFFQLTDKAEIPVPPYVPLVDNERAAAIALAMVVALVAIEGMVLWRLVRGKIFEILRLGTRE